MSNRFFTYFSFHVNGFSADFWQVVGWVVAGTNDGTLGVHWQWVQSTINSLSCVIDCSAFSWRIIEI